MKKITFITGPQQSGKTTTAKDMSKGRSTLWVSPSEINNSGFMVRITKETDLIILDGISLKEFQMIKWFVTSTHIMIAGEYAGLIRIKRPEMIIISNEISKADLDNRRPYEFIELSPSIK